MIKIKWGLRSKVLTLSSLLLLLPWFAYQFVNEMENFLRLGQQQTLLGTTSAIATALHERPTLFNEHASFLPDVKKGHDLYVYDLTNPIELNGDNNDWGEIKNFKNSYPENTAQAANSSTTNQVHFNQLLGKYSGYLYAHFEVFDQHPVKRPINNRKVTLNDHLIFAMTDPQGHLQRYIISVTEDGWFNAYQYPKNSLKAEKLTRIKTIQGIWKTTDQGYNIEFRVPLTLLGDRLGFQLNTTSDRETGKIDNVISTSNLLDIDKLGSVLVPSPEIEKILQAMTHTRSRLWVVDRHQRVIAKSGDIHQATGAWPIETSEENPSSSFWSSIEDTLISPVYNFILDTPDNSFNDANKNITQLNYALVDQALTGKSVTQWRLSDDKKVSILSAAHPIFISDPETGEQVMGAVVAEETNHGILTLRNQALQSLFNVLLGVILIAGILLFIFLSSMVNRIRKLRDQSERIIDENGRLHGNFKASDNTDEIGDLSRGMENMVKRLGQYHHYIEQLSSRLSHELRTPVAVVRSSLENLALLPASTEQEKYIQRSQQGIQRLNKILTNMSDASRIEQSLQQGDKQPIHLGELLNRCLQGYEMIYPQSSFNLQLADKTMKVNADPDFLVQLLDKIMHNAIEFSLHETPITVTLRKNGKDNSAILSIENKGPLLSNNNNQDLFQSMVSIRPTSQQHDTHLGLGLYIAKMICDYHQAQLSIANNRDLTGVEVTITFPLLSA
ncbi:proteobacterial dedicated sortase system histidine kinase [Psychromonas algicola]|uniref:proteobacterial dedicated sortase system histidine kinase n=1 Tax=Psychromonas algicola TaxID=2555642 RepID=UPI0010674A67|nr:proteobacterial dedicated sortase system histidine kinase [Psychromonas sp. RZ5]TEW51566.1 proteobacterial dedicated sortase system histidine kinase [Psychromonas sp. RZ5]